MNRGSVIIIPSEDKIEDNYFQADIDMNHLDGFQEFSNKYNLGYSFSLDDYQEAPIQIAKDGHFIIKTIKDLDVALFYIPQVVTKRQVDWLNENIEQFRFFQKIGGFSIENNDLEPERIHGYYNLTNEIKEHISNIKEGERNVR